MNICVFGAARDELAPEYFALGEALGEAMGRRGHVMIFGGGAHGLMGAAARGCRRTGGGIVSVVPRFFDGPGVLWEENTELIRTDTLAERKKIMVERARAFLVLPGGLGTFDELFEVLTMRNLGRHHKPIALLEWDGYWAPAAAMIRAAVDKGFAAPSAEELFGRFTDPEDCLDYLEREASHDL